MGRLIDADKLIKEGWRLERHGLSNALVGVKSIADVPTAFDIEAVVKELEELEEVEKLGECPMDSCSNCGGDCKGCYTRRAIEIVRKGGVK